MALRLGFEDEDEILETERPVRTDEAMISMDPGLGSMGEWLVRMDLVRCERDRAVLPRTLAPRLTSYLVNRIGPDLPHGFLLPSGRFPD